MNCREREDVERQHRVPLAPLDDDEGDQGRDADDGADRHQQRPRAGLDQRRRHAAEADRAERGAGQVETGEAGPDRPAARDSSRDSGTWRSATTTASAASGMLIRKIRCQSISTSQPPTNGPTAAADAAEPRPGADRAAPVVRVERRRDDRQAARRQQRAADALQHPAGDQQLDAGRQPAERGREREPDDPDDEDPAPPVLVAERAAEQDERGERERVAVHRPLQAGEVGAEVAADRGQRDVDDGGVDHHQRRPQDRGEQHPSSGGFAHPDEPPVRGAGRRLPGLHVGHARSLLVLVGHRRGSTGQHRATPTSSPGPAWRDPPGVKVAAPPPDISERGERASGRRDGDVGRRTGISAGAPPAQPAVAVPLGLGAAGQQAAPGGLVAAAPGGAVPAGGALARPRALRLAHRRGHLAGGRQRAHPGARDGGRACCRAAAACWPRASRPSA